MDLGVVAGRAVSSRISSYEDELFHYRIEVPEQCNATGYVVEGWAGEQSDTLALVSLGATGAAGDEIEIGNA